MVLAGGIVLLGLLMCTFTCATGNSNDTDLPFGSCLVGKESCKECYLTLKKSLLSRDDNILNLSLAFYPPQDNIPAFVSITYLFGEAPNSTTQKWFWTRFLILILSITNFPISFIILWKTRERSFTNLNIDIGC